MDLGLGSGLSHSLSPPKEARRLAPGECLSGWESFTGNDPGVMLYFLWGMYLLPSLSLLFLFFSWHSCLRSMGCHT